MDTPAGDKEVADQPSFNAVPEQVSRVESEPAKHDITDRLGRINECRTLAQAEPDPRKGVLGAVASDLCEAEAYLAVEMLNAFAGSSTIEEVEAHYPKLNLMLRLTKQIAQIHRIDQQMSRAEANH